MWQPSDATMAFKVSFILPKARCTNVLGKRFAVRLSLFLDDSMLSSVFVRLDKTRH